MDEQEYLNLFKKNQNEQLYGNLNETPKYNQYPSINETPDLSKFKIDENVNDGWGNLDIQIETRVNGVPMQNNPYYNPHTKRAKQVNDPNGLGQFLENENLNEVYRNTQPVQSVVTTVQTEPVLDNLQDVEVVSVELFEKINEKAFSSLTHTETYNKMIKS